MPVRAVPSTRTALALGVPSVTPYRVAQVERFRWDAFSNSGYQSAQSSYSWSHTVGDLNNRALLVAVAMLSVAGSRVTSVTFGGIPLIFVRSDTSPSTLLRTEFWRLTAPVSGIGTITVNLSAALDSVGMGASCAGVLQVEPVDQETGNGATLGPASTTIAPNVDGVAVLDVLASADTTVSAGAGQTERANVAGALGVGGMSTRDPISPQASATDTWNVDGLLAWSQTVIAIAATGVPTFLDLDQVTETDTARAFTGLHSKVLGQATETDTARALTVNPIHRLLGQVTETDAAQSMTRVKRLALGQATETDTARAFTVSKKVGLSQATESDSARAFSGAKTAHLSQATETDSARSMTPRKSLVLGQATETDQARTMTPLKRLPLSQASETDSARSMTAQHSRILGQASETDTARSITHPNVHGMAQASESDQARSFVRVKSLSIGQASEMASARALTVLRSLVLVMAEETDTAVGIQPIGGKQPRRDPIFPAGTSRHVPASASISRRGTVVAGSSRHGSPLAGNLRRGPIDPGNPR